MYKGKIKSAFSQKSITCSDAGGLLYLGGLLGGEGRGGAHQGGEVEGLEESLVETGVLLGQEERPAKRFSVEMGEVGQGIEAVAPLARKN